MPSRLDVGEGGGLIQSKNQRDLAEAVRIGRGLDSSCGILKIRGLCFMNEWRRGLDEGFTLNSR
jgi:hypothetical protein